MRLALEPFRPEEGYTTEEVQYNKRYTIGMISSQHLEIFKQDNGIFLQDKGSTNGTTYNGNALQRYQPVPLEQPSELQVGKVLDLLATPLPNQAGVHITRISNYPIRSHLILWDKIGITAEKEDFLQPFSAANSPAALAVIDNKFCLLNLSLDNLTYMGTTLNPNEAVPLSRGMSFDIGKITLVVTE